MLPKIAGKIKGVEWVEISEVVKNYVKPMASKRFDMSEQLFSKNN